MDDCLRCIKLEEDISTLQSEINHLNAAFDNRECNSCDELKHENYELRDEISELGEQVSQLEQTPQKDRWSDMEDDLDALRGENKKLRDEIEELDALLDNYECPECGSLQKEVDCLNRELEDLQAELDKRDHNYNLMCDIARAWNTYKLYSNINPRNPDVKELDRCVEDILTRD